MNSIDEQIRSADEVITQNISNLADNRGLLSQNILSQLRNLVEGVASKLKYKIEHQDGEYEYSMIKEGLKHIHSRGQYRLLNNFHKLLQSSASHYTFDGERSERLMLKYYEYLLKLRSIVEEELGIKILQNIELFPIDIDSSTREYYEKIAEVIENTQTNTSISDSKTDRYYIHNIKPFFINDKIYYEVTFYKAVDRVGKFNRNIAFTNINIIDKYAANLTLIPASINVLDHNMDIFIISDWQVSIRPCEFNNFAKIFGQKRGISTRSSEYRNLMKYLTRESENLLDIMDMDDSLYSNTKEEIIQGSNSHQIFDILDEARKIINQKKPGSNIIRYLMLRMNNRIIKEQLANNQCSLLSGLNLKYGCIPFDKMPYCTSPCGHNALFWDLIESISIKGREHELIARKVGGNTENNGIIYTPISELTDKPEDLSSLKSSINLYNNRLYIGHRENRRMILKNDHVFIKGYENNIAYIIEHIQGYVNEGMEGYSGIVNKWLNENSNRIDDPLKNKIIENLFKESKVAVIYGAAGTGKSTVINYVSEVFGEKTKLFLANTHAAVDNLKHRVSSRNSEFQTIASFLQKHTNIEYDLLVIDECSMVSNEDMVKILKNQQNKKYFKNLLLVGDTYQIESIKFGNWFDVVRSFIPETSVHELSTPYRTQNDSLIDFWESVRESKDNIKEKIVRHNYSASLSSSLFNVSDDDEIILCLNYDGLYGINNINRFLQTANDNDFCDIGVERYKVGDPVIFNETQRFGQEIHNNVKGKIIDFEQIDDGIQFDIQINKNNISTSDGSSDHEWIDESTVRFKVYDLGNTDEDDDSDRTTVPFQVAYATSIHKAQGLEYDSVKIVITDTSEDDISHNIFYTAITRARKNLKIFWTPETEQAIISRLKHRTNTKDIELLKKRCGLKSLK
ncbi:ATP-dependent DNA helicase [Rothia aeria]